MEDKENDESKRLKVFTQCKALNLQINCTWSHYSDHLRGFIGERRGERVDMQDAHVILDDLLPLFTTPPKE